MAKFVRIGESIIAKHTDGHTRRWNWKGLKQHPILNRKMTLYECDLNTFAEIIKECDEVDITEGCENFNKKEGDCLEANAISIYVDSKRKYKFKVEAGVSGRHKSNIFNFRDLNVCTIKTSLQNLERHISELSQIKQIDK